MSRWTRWQDWAALLAGGYAAALPLWMEMGVTATRTFVVLGLVTVAVSLWSLAMPTDRISEWTLVVMGALFIASPWVMGFEHIDDLALTAWVVGAVTLVSGLLGMPEVEQRMHVHHRPITH